MSKTAVAAKRYAAGTRAMMPIMGPEYVVLVTPILTLCALALKLPQRMANWRMRQAALTLQIADVERRHLLTMAELTRECERRHRQAAETARRNGVLSDGLHRESRRVIETEFARRRSEALVERDTQLAQLRRVTKASWYARLFADECQRA